MKRIIIGVVLFISIALNVTLLSALHAARHGGFERRPPMHALMKQLDNLPEGERAGLKEAVLQKRKEVRAAMDVLKSEREQLFEFMSSDQYSRAQAEQKLVGLRDSSLKLQQLSQEMLLDIADKLPPEQRRAFLARMKNRMKFP